MCLKIGILFILVVKLVVFDIGDILLLKYVLYMIVFVVYLSGMLVVFVMLISVILIVFIVVRFELISVLMIM